MAIGASPAGTAGAIKTTTLAKLATGTRDIFRELSPGRGFGVALVWTFVLALLVFGSLLSLLHSEPDRGADYLLFLSVSAAGNVGFAHDRVTVVGQGIITLTIAMFLGRVLPLIVLWWMAKTTREADVAVG